MATAVTQRLVSELVASRDGQRSGAVDVEWPGTSASIYFVFGQPSHATVASDEADSLEGAAALEHLLRNLPEEATIRPWRRVMVPEDTLRISADELLERLNGQPATAPPPAPALPPAIAVDDFPLLPLGVSLWSDAAANVVHLDMLAPKLPDSLVVLTADGVRAATVIARGTIVDSVYVDSGSCLFGDEASAALMRTTTGTISGYGLDDERLLASIPLLWRSWRTLSGLPAAWLDVDGMVGDIREVGLSGALLVSQPGNGAVLFHEGQLVGSYTEEQRTPSSSMARLRALFRAPGATVCLLTGSPPPAVDRALSEEAFHQFIGAPLEPSPRAASHVPPDVFSLPEVGPATSPFDVEGTAPDETAQRSDPDGDAPRRDGDLESRSAGDGTGATVRAELGDQDYVPPRLEVDMDGLRAELADIATVWLGASDAGPVCQVITRTRPGVDDFVNAVASIATLQVPGHDPAVVRAMAREMHFRVAEVLCAV
ncbi:MAG: DUF4388 domain-containing protein [Candidatus Dormibacteria bacterium]